MAGERKPHLERFDGGWVCWLAAAGMSPQLRNGYGMTPQRAFEDFRCRNSDTILRRLMHLPLSAYLLAEAKEQ